MVVSQAASRLRLQVEEAARLVGWAGCLGVVDEGEAVEDIRSSWRDDGVAAERSLAVLALSSQFRLQAVECNPVDCRIFIIEE